jgi:hypothetical protein
MNNKTIIASLGGGFTSSALMPRILLEQYDKSQLKFVNCVLPNEHPDMWRLFDAIEEKLGIEVTYIAFHPENKWQLVNKEDRDNKKKLWTPFDVFFWRGFIGNSRNDPCSSFLKRETIYHYVSDKYSPIEAVIAVGIHDDEFDRTAAIRSNWEQKGWEVMFPALGSDTYTKEEENCLIEKWYGVTLDLYTKGFKHNNCAGACVKAGQRQWAQLWYYYPEVYAEWEQLERDWQERWAGIRGKNYYILKMMRNKKYEYVSLEDFRKTVVEPAANGDGEGFLSRMIEDLPGNPACMWCSAI